MRRRTLLLAVALCAGAAAVPGCRKKTPEAAERGKAISVRVAAVREVASPGTGTATGVVAARHSADISSRLAATVRELPAHEGETVSAGALLAVLDDRDSRARLAAAQAAQRAALAEKNRLDGLVARQAATVREKEQADAAAAAASAAVAEARSALAYARLTAPFAGRVASVPVHRGDLVMPGQRLLVLEGDDGYEAQLTVESAAALRLTRGEAVAVRVDGFASPMPGRVRSVAPAGDPQTHRFLARVDLPRDPRLRSGVFASAEVPGLSGGVSRLFIPAQAVFARGGLTGVYVVEGGHAELRWIAVGERQGEVLEVRAGLSAGEKVALSPEGLSDGAPVTAAP